MVRNLNIRQIEAFKAVIERGTVSRAAQLLNVSQPAMSKLIAHLELDTGLKLFDRVKGRLAPTEHGMQLYGEVERIFSGVRQVENAVDALYRQKQGRLAVGILPGLANAFIQRATMNFLKDHGTVFCSIQMLSSHWIVDQLVTRKLDVGLVEPGLDHPHLAFQPLMDHPLVCIMPHGHPLAAKSRIEPQDLDQLPFVSLAPDSFIRHHVEKMFDAYRVKPQIVLIANVTPTLCEFVAAGLGVSLVHPLAVSGLEHRLAIRRFEPEIPAHLQICRSNDTRNSRLVDAFAQRLLTTAAQISQSMLSDLA